MAPSKEQKQVRQMLEACPHCGEPLSPWQQVLLSVDRVLVCKKCGTAFFLASRNKT